MGDFGPSHALNSDGPPPESVEQPSTERSARGGRQPQAIRTPDGSFNKLVHHPGSLARKEDSSHCRFTFDLASGVIFAHVTVRRAGLRKTCRRRKWWAGCVRWASGVKAAALDARPRSTTAEGIERSVMIGTNRCRPLTRPIDKSLGWALRRGWLARNAEKSTSAKSALLPACQTGQLWQLRRCILEPIEIDISNCRTVVLEVALTEELWSSKACSAQHPPPRLKV